MPETCHQMMEKSVPGEALEPAFVAQRTIEIRLEIPPLVADSAAETNVQDTPTVEELKAKLERAQSDLETMPMDMKAELLEENDAFQELVKDFAVVTAVSPMIIDDSQ